MNLLHRIRIWIVEIRPRGRTDSRAVIKLKTLNLVITLVIAAIIGMSAPSLAAEYWVVTSDDGRKSVVRNSSPKLDYAQIIMGPFKTYDAAVRDAGTGVVAGRPYSFINRADSATYMTDGMN